MEEALREQELYNKLHEESQSRQNQLSDQKWKKPEIGYLKLNVDVCFDIQNRCGGTGEIIRDTEGRVVLAFAQSLNQVSSAYQAEVRALTLGLKIATQAGFSSLMIESDCQQMVNKIQQAEIDPGPESMLVEEVKLSFSTLLNSSSIKYVSRFCNKVADRLASLGRRSREGQIWWNSYPLEIQNLVVSDLSDL